MDNVAIKRFQMQSEEKISLRINLLGGFSVWVDSQPLPDEAWKRRKVQTLLKLLALDSRHCLHRERLMNLLWPEAELEAARNNLRQTLHLARQTLGGKTNSALGILTDCNGWIYLNQAGSLWVDVEAFETATEECSTWKDTTSYRAALSLYSGDLLPEDPYEEWAATRREYLRDLYLNLLSKLGNLLEVHGDMDDAIKTFSRIVIAEPTAEHAHRALMRLYASAGVRHQALQQYHRLREILDRELGIDPDPDSRKLYEDILCGRFQTKITWK